MQANQGKADLARAQQQAAQIQALAEAEGEKIRLLDEGEAKKIRAIAEADAERAARVGVAQALAIDEQVQAYGGPQFQLAQQVMVRFAEAIEKSQVDVVPKIVLGSSNGGNGSLLENLMGVLLTEKLSALAGSGVTNGPRDPAAEKIRADLRKRLDPETKS